jgi:hypothetical protein
VSTALAGKQNTLTNPITGTGVAGQVAFFNGVSTQTGDNGLFWDNVNKRLGVGTNAPIGRIHALYTNFVDVVAFERTPSFNNATAASVILRAGYSASPSNGAGGTFGFQIRVGTTINDIASFGAIRDGADNSGALSFLTFTTGFQTEKLRIFSNGNTLIQNGGTFTDAGFRLDVNGTARVQGDLTISDTKNIILATGTGTKIGTATSQKLSLWNATPNVQPTTAITAGAFVANTSGIANDTATFDGYTMGQVVAALRRIGALA